MTREEAINRLQDAKDGYKEYLTDEALDMAIKSLEQEPCEDVISRADAIRIAEQGQVHGFPWEFEKLTLLPPVPPKAKVGKWIESHVPESVLVECSECGFSCGALSFNYCPNCGAKMVEPQESEGINK